MFNNKIIFVISSIIISAIIVFELSRPCATSTSPSHNIALSQSLEMGAKTEAPDERREFEISKRGGNINVAKVEAARKKMRKLISQAKPSTNLRDGGVQAWVDLGPKDIGGRIRAIAVKPNDANTIFIGAAAGGIWRSTDGGTNWTLRNNSFQAYPVTSIVYDPFNINIMYASTGEYRGGGPEFPGVGVLKSTNGGSSWSLTTPPNGPNFLWLSKIVMNPLLQNSFFVCGTTGGPTANSEQNGSAALYRSDNGGQSWRTVWTSNTSAFIADMEIHPTDTSEIIIGTDNNVRKSNNSGVSFSSQMGNSPKITTVNDWFGRRCEVEYCENDPDNIYVSRHQILDANGNGMWEDVGTELWRSTNGGVNWSLLSSTTGTDEDVNPLTSQGNYSHVLWADPSNCSRAILGGINLWKWQNNILTRITDWVDDIDGNVLGTNNSVHADFHVVVEDPSYNGSTNRKVWLGNDGGIYGTNDIWSASLNSGWFAKNTELNITQLYGADISLDGNVVVGGAQDNGYFFDTNNNNNLQTYSVYSTGDGGYCAVNKINPTTFYTTTQRGSVYRTNNGGSTFCNVLRLNGGSQFNCCNSCGNFANNSGNSDGPLFIAPFKIDPNNQSHLYAGANQLWRGTNTGNGWASIKPAIADVPEELNPAISCIDILHIGPSNFISNTIWVGHANGAVFKTTNAGSAWERVDENGIGLRDAYITDIAIHPFDDDKVAVTVGGFDDQHIYLTEDAGDTWAEISLGFDVHVETVTWHPFILDWLYVGTDVGMFASQNNGMDWSVDPVYAESEGPVSTQIAELFWQGDGSAAFPYYLCAATHGRGIWRSFAPVGRELYVDKDCTFCGLGSELIPYKTFREALDKAGPGSRIVFLTSGIYEEGAGAMLVNEDIEIVKADGVSGSVVIK